MEKENFFYEEKFVRDIEDLLYELDLEEEDVKALADDWQLKVQETNYEKMFVLTKEFITDAIIQHTDRFEERLATDDNGDCLCPLEKAIPDCIDIDKMNEAVSSLYYPNGKFTVITKQDLLDYIN